MRYTIILALKTLANSAFLNSVISGRTTAFAEAVLDEEMKV